MVDRRVNTELNSQRIAIVEQCFGSSGQQLAVPHRFLVGEGILIKMCRKKPKPRQFFLFTDILVYGNIVINKKMYNKQRILQLENIMLRPAEDDETFDLHNGWQIISPSKSFTVYAATTLEKQEWIRHMQQCIEEIIRKRGHKQIISEYCSPVWVPDLEASICMVCRKTEFNVINRRHHCRKCGVVVCGACSSHRWVLPYQSTTAVRVCSSCYDKLRDSDAQGGCSPGASGVESSGDDSSESGDEVDAICSSSSDREPSFY